MTGRGTTWTLTVWAGRACLQPPLPREGSLYNNLLYLGNRVDDGAWHHLDIDRVGGEGTIVLDGESNRFNIPGQPDKLQELTQQIDPSNL